MGRAGIRGNSGSGQPLVRREGLEETHNGLEVCNRLDGTMNQAGYSKQLLKGCTSAPLVELPEMHEGSKVLRQVPWVLHSCCDKHISGMSCKNHANPQTSQKVSSFPLISTQ